MRKITKTATVLAAMSAMTVASATMAFAATPEQKNVTANPAKATEETSAVGDWGGNAADGYTFKVDGKQFKDTWANIDGIWYYFKPDGKMASNELVVIDNETYFFYKNGTMHAGGWLEFDPEEDEMLDFFEEANLDMDEYIADINNNVDFTTDRYETVWMYFQADGKAADDEWIEDCGMHYYFDDVIMVSGDYDHFVGDNVYGFAVDGHMYVGWEKAYDDESVLAPEGKNTVWYYYNTNGKKALGANKIGNNAYSWKEIDGKWYCFADETQTNFNDKVTNGDGSFGTLITNAYFYNGDMAGDGVNGANEDYTAYYYVNADGVMQTGEVTVPKDTRYIEAETDWAAANKTKKAVDIFINAKGEVKNGFQNNYYYANSGHIIWDYEESDLKTTAVDVPTADYAYVQNAANKVVKNQKVFEVFVDNGSDTYYVNSLGKKVTNASVLVGHTTDTAADIKNGTTSGNNVDWQKKTTAAGEYATYVVAGKDGVLYEAGTYEAGRKITVGSKKLYALAESVTIGDNDVQLFAYVNEN